MKAMVLYKPGPIEEEPLVYVDVDTPRPGKGEVLVRVSKCGVCRTDLHIVKGELELRKPPNPRAPGNRLRHGGWRGS